MVQSVGFSQLNTIQQLMAQKAFSAPKTETPVQEAMPNLGEEDNQNVFMDILSSHESNILSKQSLEEIKDVASSIMADISDEDIKYGLKYGRSVLVDVSA